MKEYREKLKIDTLMIGAAALILAAVSILAAVNEFTSLNLFTPITGDSRWHSRWNGFISGASAGLLVLLVLCLIRNLRALKDEKKLKKACIKDNDERTAQIVRYAQAAAYRTVLVLGLAAVVVAGYFSMTVSLTILVCVWIAALTGALYKFYFTRKF